MSTRREILKKTVLGASFGAIAIPSARSWAEACLGITPAQTEGPFYPISQQLDSDNDLTYVKDKTQKAEGEVVYLTGVVTDGDCKPVPNALVEIWQACKSGKYSHPGDPNPAPLDPNFQYYGRSLTNAAGEYFFKTIRPGAYPADKNWMRPSHIHMKVHVLGFEELTTQMYFKGDVFNATDLILQALPKAEQNRVIVDFAGEKMNGDPLGRFDIRIKKIVGLT